MEKEFNLYPSNELSSQFQNLTNDFTEASHENETSKVIQNALEKPQN